MSSGEQGYVDPRFPRPEGEGNARFIIYGYTPSKAACIAAMILFALALALNLVQTVKLKAKYFSIPLTLGIAMEIVGYGFRAASAFINPYAVTSFVVQYFFIVVAPVLFSASIYTVLSGLIHKLGQQYTPLFPPRRIVGFFITCDVVATIVQIVGAALIGSAESNRKSPRTANNILLAGLAFQVASFFVYLVLFVIFLQKARKVIWAEDRPFLVCFIVATVLVYVRTCFRLAETAEGVYGSLMVHEAYFLGLESAPIVLAVYLLSLRHPGRYLTDRL